MTLTLGPTSNVGHVHVRVLSVLSRVVHVLRWFCVLVSEFRCTRVISRCARGFRICHHVVMSRRSCSYCCAHHLCSVVFSPREVCDLM